MFLQMMIAHDKGTEKLLAVAERRALSGPSRDLTAAVRATQADDTGRMTLWLRKHGRSTSLAADPDVHVGHGGTSALSAADVTALRRARGREFERQLLNLLLARQHTAVELARATDGNGGSAWVERLADRIQLSREAEITQALRLLAALPAA